MKKLLAAIVAVAMILSLAIVSVSAETKDPVAFTADHVTADPGESVAVTVYLNGEYEAHTLNLQFNYNTEYATMTAYAPGAVLQAAQSDGAVIMPDFNTIPGSFRLGVMCPTTAMSASGTLFTATFTVAEDVPAGTVIDLEIVVTEMTYLPVGSTNGQPVPNTTENGSITVNGEVPPTEVPPTEVPPTEVPPTEVPPTEVPPTEVPPTEVPPTEVPPTEVPPTEVPPTEVPTDVPTPPPTGAITLVGAGIAAIAAACGVVIFRKKED